MSIGKQFHSVALAWKPHFQHPDSLRVMFVLGDAGDNSEDLDSAREETRTQLQQKEIALFPIHFNHPLKDDDYKQLGQLSKLGAICNEEQWQTQIAEMYGPTAVAGAAAGKYARSYERISMCGFIEQMAELAKRDGNTLTTQVRSLTNNNLGTVLAESTGEYLTGATEMVGTLRKLRQGRLNLPEAEAEMRRHGDIALSIFQHRIRQMRKQMPELSGMLAQRPELAYSELYIAEEDGDRKLLRPVLLISQRELGKIITNMTNLNQYDRTCSQATHKRLVAESLTALLGELLHLHLDLITDADIDKWSSLSVDEQKSYMGKHKLIEEYCRNNDKWMHFLSRMEEAVRSLNPLLGDQQHPRRFTDISGVIYYWLYPEELFPIPDRT